MHNSESLLAFLIMMVFMIMYLIYQTTSPGIIVFPLVFFLTFMAATGQQPFLELLPACARAGCSLTSHSFSPDMPRCSELLRQLALLDPGARLKSKRSTEFCRACPRLKRSTRSAIARCLLGFPFMTLGLIAGTVVAQSYFGRVDFLDPKILLSVLMWAVYLIMLYTRWNAGWRGRKARLLASGAFAAAVVAWAANYFSTIHRFVPS